MKGLLLNTEGVGVVMEISNCISYGGIVTQSKHKNYEEKREDTILCLFCLLSIEFHDLFNKMQFLSIQTYQGHGVDRGQMKKPLLY